MKHIARWALVLTVFLIFKPWISDQVFDLARELPDAQTSTAHLGRAIAGLVAAPSLLAVLLFSRIDEDQALRHATRRRIQDLVIAEPGIALSELSQRLGLGWGTTVYHLNRMERAGLVSSQAVGRRRAFYAPQHDRALRQASAIMSNPAHVRLLKVVSDRRGASQREVAEAACISLPLANRYLQRLERAGLVASHKQWRVRRYEPTQALADHWDNVAPRPMSDVPSVPSTPSADLSPRETRAP